MVGNILSVIFGLLIVVSVLNDVFQSVIVPRAVGRRYRISFIVWRFLWYNWPKLAWRLYPSDEDAREDFLAYFAPFALVFLLWIWAMLLITGYGAVFWGLRAGLNPPIHSFGDALYFSGASVLTIGFGDIVARSPGARIISVAAGLSGLSILSILTAYLFLLFGAFQTREQFVVTVSARAGNPPSGVNLLCIAGYSGTRDDLPRLMIDAQRWAAQVMELQLAYPVLSFFRSSHDYESWVGTLGTLLDSATLLMTAVQGERNGQERIFFNLGRHCVHDLSHYFRVIVPHEGPGLERFEFDRACDRLESAGYTLNDRDDSWNRFAELRSSYAANLNAMADFFSIPPLQWVGDRGTLIQPPHEDRELAQERH